MGDLVLLTDKNSPCGQGPIECVWEVVANDDGFVRVAKVKITSKVAIHAKRQHHREMKTSTVVLTTPLSTLCHLEMD